MRDVKSMKNQMDIIDQKIKLLRLKGSIDGFNSRLHTVEDRIEKLIGPFKGDKNCRKDIHM